MVLGFDSAAGGVAKLVMAIKTWKEMLDSEKAGNHRELDAWKAELAPEQSYSSGFGQLYGDKTLAVFFPMPDCRAHGDFGFEADAK